MGQLCSLGRPNAPGSGKCPDAQPDSIGKQVPNFRLPPDCWQSNAWVGSSAVAPFCKLSEISIPNTLPSPLGTGLRGTCALLEYWAVRRDLIPIQGLETGQHDALIIRATLRGNAIVR